MADREITTETLSVESTSSRVWLGGSACDLVTRNGFFDYVKEAVAQRGEVPALAVSSFNLNHLYYYGVDGEYEGFFSDAEAGGRRWLVTIDGVPIERAVTKFTGNHWPKLSGSDVIEELLELAAASQWRVAVVGGDPDRFAALVQLVEQRWSGLVIQGWFPRRDAVVSDNDTTALEVAAFGADIVVVALPKPFSEQWIDRWGAASGAGALFAFGAAIDFLTQFQTRAPQSVSRRGGEWLWRLAHNPRRLWRRYLIEGPGEMLRLRKFQGYDAQVTTPAMWRKRIGGRLLIFDIVVAVLASVVASLLRVVLRDEWFASYSPSVWAVAVAIPTMIASQSVAKGRRVRGVVIDGSLFARFFAGVGIGVAGVGLVSFAGHLEFSRGYVGLLGVLCAVAGGLGRLLYGWHLERTRANGRNLVRLATVGTSTSLEDLAAWFRSRALCGYRVVGRFDSLDQLSQVPVGVVALGGSDASALVRSARRHISDSSEIIIAADLVSVDARRLEPMTFADQSVLHLAPVEIGLMRSALKRFLDIVVATSVLVVTSPLLAYAAWRVKREDGGPFLFRQTRVGQGGRPFSVLKLRTMVVDAEARQRELLERNEAGSYMFKMADDPRITSTGKWLRAWSIDELPQLWNVVRGDMSLVGPRPALVREVENFPEEAHLRHLVRPGMTGLWQVSGRSSLDSTQALSLDIHYVVNWSLGSDLSILLRTVRAVLQRDGAH